jgi:ribosome biogenesis GTPase A
MVHYTIVLGITGKGKSSFINAMNGTKVAATSSDGNR